MRALLVVAFVTGLVAQAPVGKAVVLKPEISDARGLRDFDLDGSGGWSVRGPVLSLDKAGVPGGPIRRPAAIAILKGAAVTDFTLQVEARSTAPVDLAVRDVLLIFGYQSPTQFYYVHLAAKTDDVHNGIFVSFTTAKKSSHAPEWMDGNPNGCRFSEKAMALAPLPAHRSVSSTASWVSHSGTMIIGM